MPGPFSYLNNIPQPTDQLSVSQGNLLTNFGSIQSIIDVNHVDFASVDAGKHKFITFPVQSVTPTFTGTEFGLFNEVNVAPLPLVNQLWINNPSNLFITQVPMAASIFDTAAAPGVQSTGYSYLPSGFIIQWGTDTSQASTNINFAIPFPHQVIQVVASSANISTPKIIGTGNYNLGTFQIFFTGGGTTSITYFAIGY